MYLAIEKLGNISIGHPLESVEMQMEAQLIGSGVTLQRSACVVL